MSGLSDLLQGMRNWPAAIGLLSSVMTVVGGAIIIVQTITNRQGAATTTGTTSMHDIDYEKLDARIDDIASRLIAMKNNLGETVPVQIKNIETDITEMKAILGKMQTRQERLADIMIMHFRNRSRNPDQPNDEL